MRAGKKRAAGAAQGGLHLVWSGDPRLVPPRAPEARLVAWNHSDTARGQGWADLDLAAFLRALDAEDEATGQPRWLPVTGRWSVLLARPVAVTAGPLGTAEAAVLAAVDCLADVAVLDRVRDWSVISGHSLSVAVDATAGGFAATVAVNASGAAPARGTHLRTQPHDFMAILHGDGDLLVRLLREHGALRTEAA